MFKRQRIAIMNVEKRRQDASKKLHPLYRFLLLTLCCLLVLGEAVSSLSLVPATALAAVKPPAPTSTVKANTYNHTNDTKSKSQSYTPAAQGSDKVKSYQSMQKKAPLPMSDGEIELQRDKKVSFKGSDGHLEVIVPEGSFDDDDLKQSGKKIKLKITQYAPASGSSAGGSGRISLGSYTIQVLDENGKLAKHGLRKPLEVKYHFDKKESALDLSRAYIIMNAPRPQDIELVQTSSVDTTTDDTFGKYQSINTQMDTENHTLSAVVAADTASSSMTFHSDAPVAVFGKPDPFSVDLNAGGLTAGFPIELPDGPGGLEPPVSLSYSSSGVTEQHNPSASAGWVGEGWNLSLGSIHWAEHNVLAGCKTTGCGPKWQSTWQINDPFGTSSELIPPDINVSTFYDDTPNSYCATGVAGAYPCPVNWQTADDTDAKVISYVGPVDIGEAHKPPCFRVWLPNGIMEEFGCTADSIAYYPIPGIGMAVSGWYLNLVTDAQGNQIQFTYQRDMVNWTSPSTGKSYTYPRDIALSTIEYNSPNCRNSQQRCTGTNWNPLVRVNFASSHAPENRTNAAPTGCNTGANLRCDNPFDLTSSGGTAAPMVQTTYILNRVQVQNRPNTTSSWNTLREYRLGYEQSAPTTAVDPVTGKNMSVAGMLDLTEVAEVGAGGANALMYSGKDNSTSTSYAYLKLHDVSSKNIVVKPNTTLSYWIYPQSSSSNGGVSGNNSTCVALDLIFTDGSALRGSSATDQAGNSIHPKSQCGRLTLDQWNRVTVNLGSAVNGKTISKIDIGYDQPANTGGYRGYVDNIRIANGMTNLFTTDFEANDAPLTWTNTVDTGPEAQAGNSSNVIGFKTGVTGPEAGERSEEFQADSAALPKRTFGYTTVTNYYQDSVYKPVPTTNCGPSWNTGHGTGCVLWSQSYPNNSRYMATANNGMGLQQTFSWMLAHNNTHGVNGGGTNNVDPFYCNGRQTSYPCNEADDQNWSRVVLTQENETVVRLTQNGIGGQKTNTPVTTTTNYIYKLKSLVAQPCGDCVVGMYWGNQNNANYLGYYDSKFMGFAEASVSLPDGSKEIHKYHSTQGYGLYDMAQITCYHSMPCHNAPWWNLENAAHGREYETQIYDTDGVTLLEKEKTTYQAVCPPSGVQPTPPKTGLGNWNGQRVSSLNNNNPVAACDVREVEKVSESYNRTANKVVSTTTPTYDSNGRVVQQVSSTSNSPNQQVVKTAYLWRDAITATQNSATGTYIVETASTFTEDGQGNRTSCTYYSFDGQGYATGATNNLTKGLETTEDTYTDCGTAANNYAPTGRIRTTSVYDVYGSPIASDDANANASIAGFKGCTLNSVQYSSCSTYDSTFPALLVSGTNTLNHTSRTSYSNTTTGGFGFWPMSSTDSNGQTTSFGYDPLGRSTTEKLPGETGNWTRNWVYSSWCSNTAAQAPCLEVDEVERIDDSTLITNRAFYDGYGRLVSTRQPGPDGFDVVAYATYNAEGKLTFESNSYFVPEYNGPAGPEAFSPPDSTQVGTSTQYDALERVTRVTNPNSHTTTTSYTIQCGVPGYSDNNCYELKTIIDADGHKRTTLSNGLDQVTYDQRYNGNTSANYSLYVTTVYQYDADGALIAIQHPNTGTTTFTYDDAGRKVQQSDPNRGLERFDYDPNGNIIKIEDARGGGGTVYASYDGLNRLLWRNTTNSPNGAHVTFSYDSTANGNFGIGRKTSATFTGPNGLNGSYAYTYDRRGQAVSQTTTVNGTNYTVQKAYDNLGQPTSQTYPTGEVVTTAYSSRGWLSLVSTSKAGTTTTLASEIGYTGAAGAAMKITSMKLGNGMYTYAANYDFAKRLTESSLSRADTSLLLFKTQPTYNNINNITSVRTTLGSETDQQQFCYDDQSRLTWAGSNGTAPCTTLAPGTLTSAYYQQTFGYDTNGRLTNGAQGTYQYNSGHLHAVSATSSGYTATYDAAGNMVCRAPTSTVHCETTDSTGQALSYDAEGNLTTWKDQPTPTKTVNYLYDGEGERLATQMDTGGGTPTVTVYIDDIAEVKSDGNTTTTTTYYYAAGQRIALAVNGSFSYMGHDVLGTPVIALNPTGVISAIQLYGPYGDVRYQSGNMPTSVGFTGHKRDADTGLDYFGSRYYDSTVGQFISPDSALPENGYNPWGLSRYAYVQGNPETLTDPDGHCWPLCTMAIGAAIGAAVSAGVSIASQAAAGKPIDWREVGKEAAVGAVSGAISGLAGPGAGFATRAAIGAASSAGGQMVSNALNNKPLGDGVLVAAAFGAVTGGGSGGKAAKGFSGAIKKNPVAAICGHSFTPETEVSTPQGMQAISSLQEGDQVLAYDPETKRVTSQIVKQVHINHDSDLLDVTLANENTNDIVSKQMVNTKQQDAEIKSNGIHAPPGTFETIHTTQSHPWLTKNKGWIEAGNLKIGDRVQRLDGTFATVTALQIKPGEMNMYDLSVSNVHTFAVGHTEIIVHNTYPCGGKLPSVSKKQVYSVLKNIKDNLGNSNAYAKAYVSGTKKLIGQGRNAKVAVAGGTRGSIAPNKKLTPWQGCGKGNCAEYYALKQTTKRGQAVDLYMVHKRGVGPCAACIHSARATARRNRAAVRLFWFDASEKILMRIFRR